MSHVNRGLPLSNSRVEQVFPTLTPAQIRRIATPWRTRVLRSGEVLVERGDSAVPFFVVISGELEVLRPSGVDETLVTVHAPGQLTGEVGSLSGCHYMRPRKGLPLSPYHGRRTTQNTLRGPLKSYDRVDRTETEVIERQRATS